MTETFGNTIGAKAFPDVEERKLKDVLDQQMLITDAAFKRMKYGEVVIVLATIPPSKTKFSCLIGGEVVRDKVREAVEKKMLPLLGTVTMTEGGYYDIA